MDEENTLTLAISRVDRRIGRLEGKFETLLAHAPVPAITAEQAASWRSEIGMLKDHMLLPRQAKIIVLKLEPMYRMLAI